MDRRETPSGPGGSSSSSTERASRAPTKKTDRHFKRSMSTCVRCYNHGKVDQIKDRDHFCAFRGCKCDKCTRYSEHRSAQPTRSDSKEKEAKARRKRHLAQEKKASGPAPAHAQSHVQKASSGAGGTSKVHAGKSPRGSADQSLPKVRGSAPDARKREDATKNASFLRDLMASDPDFDAVEWERKLLAAEALLTLKNSSRPRVATLTQPCIEPANAHCPDVKPQRN